MHATKLILLLLIHLAAATLLVAQEDEDKDKIKYPVEMKPFTLTLVDEEGKPVKDVKVQAAGLRCEESPGSWISWPENNAGDNRFLSDENGVAETKYPVKLGAPGQWMTTNKIDFWLQHPDFVSSRVELEPALRKATHTLVQGCRTTFTCVDDNGKAIEKFSAVIAGPASPIWRRTEGELQTSGIPDGSWQTILVAPSDDGVHLFSGVLPARYAKGKDVTIRNAKLRPGMRISGSLSDNVPRPVVNGKVVAWCLPKPAGDSWGEKDPSIGWSEEAKVNEDGSFEFLSLPRGGKVQLIAICNGWLTSKRERGFTVGQMIDISEEHLASNHVTDITLDMEATGTLEVEVLGPDGKPLVGAEVSTWPNQKLHLSGSNIVGESYSSIRSVINDIAGTVQDINAWQWKVSRYSGKTNEQGKITLTEIPMNANGEIYAGFDNMRVKREDGERPKDNFFDGITYICKSTEPEKITIHMELIRE